MLQSRLNGRLRQRQDARNAVAYGAGSGHPGEIRQSPRARGGTYRAYVRSYDFHLRLLAVRGSPLLFDRFRFARRFVHRRFPLFEPNSSPIRYARRPRSVIGRLGVSKSYPGCSKPRISAMMEERTGERKLIDCGDHVYRGGHYRRHHYFVVRLGNGQSLFPEMGRMKNKKLRCALGAIGASS
jgi:hypothetical protein